MTEPPTFRPSTVVLGAPDPRALAAFYQRLLGWSYGAEEDDWVTLRHPEWPFSLGFQREVGHVPPTWPAGLGDQQMQVHLDIEVDDLDAGVAYAVESGATVAEVQPQDDVRVLIDPDGHPFCLVGSLGAAPAQWLRSASISSPLFIDDRPGSSSSRARSSSSSLLHSS